MANLVLLPKKKSPSHKGDDPRKVLNLSCILRRCQSVFFRCCMFKRKANVIGKFHDRLGKVLSRTENGQGDFLLRVPYQAFDPIVKAYRRTWPGFSLKIRVKRGLEYKGPWRDHFAHEIFALRYMPNGRYFAAAGLVRSNTSAMGYI